MSGEKPIEAGPLLSVAFPLWPSSSSGLISLHADVIELWCTRMVSVVRHSIFTALELLVSGSVKIMYLLMKSSVLVYYMKTTIKKQSLSKPYTGLVLFHTISEDESSQNN